MCKIFLEAIYWKKKEKALYHLCTLTRANTLRKRPSYGENYIKNIRTNKEYRKSY